MWHRHIRRGPRERKKLTGKERSGLFGKEAETGRSTCRVEVRRKRPRLLEGWTTTMFDIRTVNLDADSYLRMTPKKDLVKAEKDKKDLYIQSWMERRC